MRCSTGLRLSRSSRHQQLEVLQKCSLRASYVHLNFLSLVMLEVIILSGMMCSGKAYIHVEESWVDTTKPTGSGKYE